MASFDLDAWWEENVDPEMSLLDKMYKEITQEAIAAALKFHKVDVKEQMERDSIDIGALDFSDVLRK